MNNNRILVISPHADDVTIFMGGTVRKLADEGMQVYVVRVTNDDFDSCGITKEETILNNKIEAEAAYKILGVYETIHLGYTSDHMACADYLELREKFVCHIRQIRPKAVYSFDIDGKDEENMDHRIIANAFAEALWISSFDQHHPEHFSKGLSPYSVPERIYFSRIPENSNSATDISSVLDKKIQALQCHKTIMKNFFHQIDLRAKSLGRNIETLSQLPTETLIAQLTIKYAGILGEPFGFESAELFRDTGTGLLDALFHEN